MVFLKYDPEQELYGLRLARKCPACEQPVAPDALICPHCQTELADDLSAYDRADMLPEDVLRSPPLAALRTSPASKISGPVALTLPEVQPGDLRRLVDEWIWQQRGWPVELPAPTLTENLRLYFVPWWVISGTAKGKFTARVGQDRTTTKKCPACKGSGQRSGGGSSRQECRCCNGTGEIDATERDMQTYDGQVEATLRYQMVQHRTQSTLRLRWKRPGDLTQWREKAGWLSRQQAERIQVIAPERSIKCLDVARAVLTEALYDEASHVLRDAWQYIQGLNITDREYQAPEGHT